MTDAPDFAVLQGPVQEAREVLTRDLEEILEGTFGLHRDGRREAVASLPALSDPRARETRDLLERLLPTKGADFGALVRQLAFTHLNRLVALKMMEQRKLVREAVGRGIGSNGLKFWMADRPDEEHAFRSGEQDAVYRRFLLWLSGELHGELGVLFDADDLASRIFPRPQALAAVLDLVNAEALSSLWAHEEALGWVYQFYTPKKLRDDSHKRGVPADSFELAFRNQFYTPHYVVRFLTDNSLGRLWLEMNPGTALWDKCTYLLVPPPPSTRPKKDPRTIKVLDPACGSGHFLLYAFELLEVIYREAWEDPDLGPVLRHDFADRVAFEAAIPVLLVEENLHGIDIDERAAQIASLALYLKAKSRNAKATIRKSHIVCAQPPPGDASLFDDFKTRKAGNGDSVLVRILSRVWEALQLAGEAGTLLRAEDVVARLVDEERAAWRKLVGKGKTQEKLFPDEKREPETLDFSDVLGESFWRNTEDRIEKLLQEYATEAAGAEGAHRRIFAEDGLSALRFVDALRERYDVVLMNPPFGKGTKKTKKLIDSQYSDSKADLATCFVERGIELAPAGYVGVLSTEAGFFRRTLEQWRKRIVLRQTTLQAVAHLGGHVLEGATVRTGAYVLGTPASGSTNSVFLRVLEKKNRIGRLGFAVDAVRRQCSQDDSWFVVDQREFDKLPYATFGYWCSTAVRDAFARHPALQAGTADVQQGLATADDFRFLRLRWEVPPESVGEARTWVPFAKGGEYSPFHDDVHLLVNWLDDGSELKAWITHRYDYLKGKWEWVIKNSEYYFRPGLTYPRRTNKRFAPRAMPAGCAFADKGPGIFTEGDDTGRLLALLGVVNSRVASHLVSLGLGAAEAEGGAGANSYEVGLVQRLAVPAAAASDTVLTSLVSQAVALARAPDRRDETTALFVLPIDCISAPTLAEATASMAKQSESDRAAYRAAQSAIEARVLDHYGFGEAQRAEIEHFVPVHDLPEIDATNVPAELARRVVSWAVGVAFGRWDVRLATGDVSPPPLPDPFAGFKPASPAELTSIPSDYPIATDSDGILALDEGHEDDIVARVHDVLRVVWRERADDVEGEIRTAVGVKSLRDYFAKPTAFFRHHVDSYSKSKRKAPIYWLLQSPDRGYSVLLYAPRVDRDTLYKVLGSRYLAGKIMRTKQAIEELRPGGQKKAGISKKEDKKLAKLDELLVELEEFDARLRRIADTYDPHPEDGALINLAPLHDVVPWPKEKDELRGLWKDLQDGEHDWSHLAMRRWPDRVRENCKTDLSLAIAHGLDEEMHPGKRAELRQKLEEARNRTDEAAGEDEEDDEGNDGDEA